MVLPLPKNEEWDQQFLKYQEQFNIPNIVNLVYGDNKLLLNLSLANHRYLLMKNIRSINVRLVESFYLNQRMIMCMKLLHQFIKIILSRTRNRNSKI